MRLRTTGALALAAVLTTPALIAVPTSPAVAVPVPPNSCVNPDNGLPRVTDIAVSRTRVTPATGTRWFEVSVAAEDTGGPGPASGVAQVSLVADGETEFSFGYGPMTLGGDGRWHRRVQVPVNWPRDDYVPTVQVLDVAGNIEYGTPGYDGLPEAKVRVLGVRDLSRPELRRLHLDKPAVNTRRSARTVLATITVRRPEKTPIQSVKLGVNRPGVDPRPTMRRISQSGRLSTWRGAVHVPRGMGDGRWRLKVWVYDEDGPMATFSREQFTQLRREGREMDGAIRVTSREDRVAPTATGLTLTPPVVDVTTGTATVTASVSASDAMSGVTSVRVWLVDAAENRSNVRAVLHRVAGNRYQGRWEATIAIPHCGIAAGTLTADVQVLDHRGREGSHLRAGTVTVTNTDTLPPRVIRTSTVTAPPRLVFDEPVTGITTTSAVVTYVATAGGGGSGSWTCTDATGATTSCADGLVSTATYVLDPAPANAMYHVQLNPDHVLSIVDLAGNPVGRRLTPPA